MNADASRSLFPPPRVTPHALHALGGLWRINVRRYATPSYWLTLACTLVVLAVMSFPAAPTRAAAAQGFLPWAAGFYVCFIVPVVAFLSAAGAMRDDLGAASVDYVLTRPLRRPAFVVFRYLTHMVCAQIDFLFGLAVIAGIGVFHDVPGLWAALPILLGGQIMAIITFGAFGFFCGLATSRYVIVGLIYGVLIELAFGNAPTQLNQVSLLRQLLGLVRPVLGGEDGAITGAAMTSTLTPLAIVAVLLAFSAAIIALSAALFRLKEFAGAAGREA